MARPNSPWFRKSTGTWVTKVRGRQYTLAHGEENRDQAVKAFHELMASIDNPIIESVSKVTVGTLANHYTSWTELAMSPARHKLCRIYVGKWVEFIGRNRPASAVALIDIDRWLAGYDRTRAAAGKGPLADSSRQTMIEIVRGQYVWGKRPENRLVAINPFEGYRGPGYEARECNLDAATVARILAILKGHSSEPIVEFLWETGCRPSEAYTVTIGHLRLNENIIEKPSKTTKKTRKLRVIYLTPRAKTIVLSQIRGRVDGHVFLRRNGKPWNDGAMYRVFKSLRVNHGFGADCTAEGLRHGYGTDAALKHHGMVVAGLMGHTSTKVTERYYVNLHRRKDEMLAAAAAVRTTSSGQADDSDRAREADSSKAPSPSAAPPVAFRKRKSKRQGGAGET